MPSIDLNGTWQLTFGPQCDWGEGGPEPAGLAGRGWPTIDAVVPGNVELDLMRHGLLPDLAQGNHIYLARQFEGHEWWYRRSFTTPPLPPGHRAELVFEGLDTVGLIWVNGVLITETRNMLVRHRMDITNHLRTEGDNELVVRIGSAVLEGRKHVVEPLEVEWSNHYESIAVRKAAHMYGWDIMPRLVSAGLWRAVRIDIVPPTRFRYVYWWPRGVDVERNSADLEVMWDFQTERHSVDDLRVRITLAHQGQTILHHDQPLVGTHGRRRFHLDNARLWWPRGYGEAALYDASVQLLDSAGTVIDEHRCRVGLRSIELERTDTTTPAHPGQFLFRVNGERIFIKGTNWVPLDALHSRDPQHLPQVFPILVDLNCNMVRCWGGNVYEDHAFFDLCDENGILVWQDFSLGCAVYPQDDEFAQTIECEARTIVEKLRNHPSLTLWAGNNECDLAFASDPNHDRLTRQVLADVVRRLDPSRPYLPSSPYVGPELVQRGRRGDEMPEQHLWSERHDYKGKSYSQTTAHFASEIGFHGCPSVETLQQMLDPEFLWPWQDNDQWLTKCVRWHRHEPGCTYRVPLMARLVEVMFGTVPDNLEDFVLASQITQAEAFKFAIEHFRVGKWRRTGILWWNLRDGWPILSDAIVDYYNHRKLAYEYIQRSQADVLVIVDEPVEGQHPLAVVNDTRNEVRGRAQITDTDSGQVLLDTEYRLAANGKMILGALPAAPVPAWWRIDYSAGNRSHATHYLAGPRPYSLETYRRWLGR